jgi:hypothetical protein
MLSPTRPPAVAVRRSSDGFPIVVTLVSFVLMFLGQTVYERLAYDWILGELAAWIDTAQAELIEKISAVAVPAGVSLLLVWGFYVYAKRELTRQAERDALRPKRPAYEEQEGVGRDVWLYDAICRIFLGRWDKIPLRSGRLDLDGAGFPVLHDLITHHVRQLATDGRLPVWGKKQGYWALWELSPPDFWKHHQIDYESFLQADPRMLHALPCEAGSMVSMRELMTSKAAVEAFCESVAL